MSGTRKAGIEDMPFVYERMCDLEQTIFDRERFAVLFEAQLDDKTMESLIYEVDGVPAAYAAIRYGTYLHHCAKTAELIELDVVEPMRKEGVGTKFLKDIEMLARQKGCVELALATNQKRKKAHRFYEKRGMKQTHFTYTKNI
ncbi:GNAT family N-acetyltransferase [Dubosiella muris]|uniref:GNAT family N-acetyltransferase n=1 Tax=Dubosiella muris TaxID=3038133 RepID=A0AC61R5Z4_9FIRM|nr:GNAT family N-acetyltransferase [Dubosiella muris]TGY65338.1 GNAT family N-acetyltransferase [Dubosiella muris]